SGWGRTRRSQVQRIARNASPPKAFGTAPAAVGRTLDSTVPLAGNAPGVYNRSGFMQDSLMRSLTSQPRRRFISRLPVLALALACVPFARGGDASPALLVVGDSISAAYGLSPGTGWVDLLS